MAAANAPGLKAALLRRAIQAKLERLEATGIDTHPLWDRLVFKKVWEFSVVSFWRSHVKPKVRQLLGGEIKLIASGSAPLSPKVFNFLRIAFSCIVIEGFGATETCATCLRLAPGDPAGAGYVGFPPTCCEAKLCDVPSMGYSVDDKPYPRGELLIRGDNTFTRYHKSKPPSWFQLWCQAAKSSPLFADPESTREVKDEEGWVHTGDIAAIDECGRFKIIDRMKVSLQSTGRVNFILNPGLWLRRTS